MTRRQKFLLLLAFGLVVGIAVWSFTCEREPSYNGRSLSQWHALYDQSVGIPHPPHAEEAADAIRQIGTNAIPYYLKWIQFDQPELRVKLDRLVGRLPFPQSSMEVVHGFVGGVPAWVYGNHAMAGFQLLGTNACGAIPQLAQLMTNKSHWRRGRQRSLWATWVMQPCRHS